MTMLTSTPPTVDRDVLLERYARNRRRSKELFASIAAEAYYARPIPLRHPFVFYEGHLPGFSFLTLVRKALHGPAIDEDLERLFERGIDPAGVTEAEQLAREAWPLRRDVLAFAVRCDAAVTHALAHAPLAVSDNPLLVRAQAAYNIIEHEQMHHETLLYIIHRLPIEHKHAPPGGAPLVDGPRPPHARVPIAAGSATLGAARDEIVFGWDNEFERTVLEVPAFEIDRHNVTNGDYLEFVKAGGPVPPFWTERGGVVRLSTVYAEIDLPLSWPVYVTHTQAAAYARWQGRRLPTEAQYHRAAFGAPDGSERAFPWGAAAPRGGIHGNFDFARWDPVPAGSYPAGVSAWGVHDLIGNGWEWTASEFAPLPGFTPLASYPPYSTDFFDGDHYVVKGASPVTDAGLIRRSFRNWFRQEYPYVYASFRCVS